MLVIETGDQASEPEADGEHVHTREPSDVCECVVRFEPDVVGELFTITTRGKIVGPLKGNYGTYAVVIDEVVEPAPKEDYSFEKMQMQQMFTGRAQNGLYEALQKASDVTDNRAKFY